jgi:hypothetical protein
MALSVTTTAQVTQGTDDVSSQNFTFTAASNTTCIVVGVSIRTNQGVSAMTWNGTAMTKEKESTVGSSRYGTIWTIHAPVTGTKTLAITYTGTDRATVAFIPLTCTNATSSSGSAVERDASAPVDPQAASMASTATDLGVAICASGTSSDLGGTVTSDGGQSRQLTGTVTGFRANIVADTKTGSGSTLTMGYSNSNTGDAEPFTCAGVSIAEAAGANKMLSLLGVGA